GGNGRQAEPTRRSPAVAEQIIVFDTTLRDGEQAPGINLNAKAKLEIAEQLAKLGVDVIEAGFPQASVGDFEAVRAVAGRVKGATIAALARTAPGAVGAPAHGPTPRPAAPAAPRRRRRAARGPGPRRPGPAAHLHRHQPH